MSSPAQAIGVRAHRRQFIVGPEPVRVYDDWMTHELGPSLWLSCCPALPIGFARDADGHTWALLGLAVQTRKDAPAPLEAIRQTPTADIPAATYDWAGRWLILNAQSLLLDALGALGCYYGQKGGACWASSSPALVADRLYDGQPPPPREPGPVYRRGVDWSMMPGTRTQGVYRLFPSQRLALTDHALSFRPLLPSIDTSGGVDAAVDQVISRLTETIRNLRSLDEQVWLGLTAGRDSRSVLAVCKAAALSVKVFTRNTPRMMICDHVLPPRLAAMCGYEHHWTHSKPITQERLALAQAHARGEVTTGDMVPFLSQSRDAMDGLMIGGHGFEIFSKPLFETFPQHLGGDLDTLARAAILDQNDSPQRSPAAFQSMIDWLVWTRDNPDDNIDWRDRFVLEQDNGAWISSKEMVYDMNRVARVPLLNCAHNYALLLSLPPEERKGTKIHERMIRQAMPELLGLPFNPTNRSFGLRVAVRVKSWRLPMFIFMEARKRLYKRWAGWRNKRRLAEQAEKANASAN